MSVEGLRSTRTSRRVAASAEDVWDAFMDPEALVAWLPPAEMTGRMHDWDGRVGGGYRMSLFYPPDENTIRGKTAEREDMVQARFVELERPRRIVEAVTFVTDDPELAGEMTMTVTLEAGPGGTEVTLLFEHLPPG